MIQLQYNENHYKVKVIELRTEGSTQAPKGRASNSASLIAGCVIDANVETDFAGCVLRMNSLAIFIIPLIQLNVHGYSAPRSGSGKSIFRAPSQSACPGSAVHFHFRRACAPQFISPDSRRTRCIRINISTIACASPKSRRVFGSSFWQALATQICLSVLRWTSLRWFHTHGIWPLVPRRAPPTRSSPLTFHPAIRTSARSSTSACSDTMSNLHSSSARNSLILHSRRTRPPPPRPLRAACLPRRPLSRASPSLRPCRQTPTPRCAIIAGNPSRQVPL